MTDQYGNYSTGGYLSSSTIAASGTLQSGFTALAPFNYYKFSYAVQSLNGSTFFSVTNNTSNEQYQILAGALKHQ